MNQPRFKFGETVYNKFTKQFSVTGIQYRANSCPAQYYYHSYPQGWTAESELELYQEPKKKVLFAYINNSHVIHSITETDLCNLSGVVYARIPCYDLEYPSEEVK